MTIAMVYVTYGDVDEAKDVTKEVVQERLAACAMRLAGESLYWWEDEMEAADEVVVLYKTRRDLVPSLTRRLRELHSYDTPCILAWGAEGDPGYESWVGAETV